MKRNEKTQLFAKTTPELRSVLAERDIDLIKAMQERSMPNRTGLDIKRASRIRAEMKMIKTELHRRALQGEVQE